MAKWLPPNGFTAKVHQMDTKVGGSWRMSFFNFTTGHEMPFEGKYLELAPNERISYTSAFDDKNLPGKMVTTITLAPVSAGVEMHVVQEGIPAAIPPTSATWDGSSRWCCWGSWWRRKLLSVSKLVTVGTLNPSPRPSPRGRG